MTQSIPNERRRRCTPRNQWPEKHQARWLAALQPGGLLEESGCRARHSAYSNKEMEKGHGIWVNWSESQGDYDPEAAPGDLVTPARVRAYVADLENAGNKTGTVITRLIELKVMGGIMDTEKDFSWIGRIIASVRLRHQPARLKRNRVVSPTVLWDFGTELICEADQETTLLRQFRASRDGLMVAFLAARPLRLGNFTGLTLGRTLQRRGEDWYIQIPASEVKNRMRIELPLPNELVPYLELYLARYRSALLRLRYPGGKVPRALWLSTYGTPMTDNGIYIRICARTRERFGAPINPHLFRDCVATAVAVEDPAHVGTIPSLLTHRRISTAEDYYNQGKSLDACRRMQEVILSLRRKSKRMRNRQQHTMIHHAPEGGCRNEPSRTDEDRVAPQSGPSRPAPNSAPTKSSALPPTGWRR